jgi:hypothetical protein
MIVKLDLRAKHCRGSLGIDFLSVANWFFDGQLNTKNLLVLNTYVMLKNVLKYEEEDARSQSIQIDTIVV